MGWPGREHFWIRLTEAIKILLVARVSKGVSTSEHDRHVLDHDE